MAEKPKDLGSLFASRAGKKKSFKLKASKGVAVTSKVQKLPTKEEEEVVEEVKDDGGIKDISDIAKEKEEDRQEFDRAALEREENARMLAAVREKASEKRVEDKPAEETGVSSLRSGISMGWRERQAQKESARVDLKGAFFPTLDGGDKIEPREGPVWGAEAAAVVEASAAQRRSEAPAPAAPGASKPAPAKKAAKSALDFDVDALGSKKKAVKVKNVALPGTEAAPLAAPAAAAPAPAPEPAPAVVETPAADRFAGLKKKKKKKKAAE